MVRQIYILVVLIGFSLGTLKAQPYQKLISPGGNHWYVTTCDTASCQLDYYFGIEDTIMDGKTYRFLDNYHYLKNMLIREDTVTRQIFFRSATVTKDLLIYDFSLNVGNTIEVFNPNSPLPHSSGYYTLDSIVPRAIKGGTHRFFYLSQALGNKTVWVEGMGSMALINTPASERDLYGIGEVTCYYRNGIYFYESDTLPDGPCDTTLMQTSISDLSIEDEGISIYPNPSNGFIKIYDRNNDAKSSYSIYDIQSKLIETDQLINDQKIDLTSMDKGVYIIHISNKKGLFTRKLILQ